MAHLPLPTASTLPKHAPPALPSLFASGLLQPLEVSALFAKLGKTTDGAFPPLESILGSITDAARAMTGASGIALALGGKGTIICRASAGEIAPRLGGQLNVDSGISGECFRTGQALRCDDTQTDDRVDPEVCRVLGIRSIAVVPLHGRGGTVGILEALSSRPQAFTGEHLSLLQRLAEIGAIAFERELGANLGERTAGVPEIRNEFVRSQQVAASVSEALISVFGDKCFKNRHRYWIVGGIALALILVSAVIWISLSDTDGDAVASAQAIQSQTVAQQNPSHSAPTVPSWKPAGRLQARELSARGALRNATINEPVPVTDSKAPPPGPNAAEASVARSSSSLEVSTLLPPEVAAGVPDTAAISALISKPATPSAADLVISRGVTEAILVHSVLPVYPPRAHVIHLAGTVVLEETIAEDGSTRDVKVISGSSLLAEAATQAVSQWRYRPSLLNGKPVSVQKQVTIIFKNP